MNIGVVVNLVEQWSGVMDSKFIFVCITFGIQFASLVQTCRGLVFDTSVFNTLRKDEKMNLKNIWAVCCWALRRTQMMM